MVPAKSKAVPVVLGPDPALISVCQDARKS